MHDWKNLYLFLLSSFIFCVAANAQQAHEGLWLGTQVQLKFSEKWAWQHDAGFRTVSTNFTPHQMLYRTGLRYLVNKNFSVAGGGAMFFTRSSFERLNDEFGRELRLWQEALHQTNIKKILWQNRFTTEQRFFDETTKKPSFTAYRFRIKTTFTKPLNEKWSLQISDEYMRQLAQKVFAFDQNRVMLYGIYNFNTTTSVRSGYMWLLTPGNHSRHVLNFNYFKILNLKQSRNKNLKA